MSLITRCPACVTLFKVVPDQLRISDGWVRCGQCDEVFDASQHLQSAEQAAPLPSVDLDLTNAVEEHSDVSPLEQQPSPVILAEDAVPDDQQPALKREAMDETEVLAPDSGGPLANQGEVTLLSDAIETVPGADLELDSVSFLRAADVRLSSSKPWQRISMQLLTIGLILGLAGQVVFHERDRLAAAEPALKPVLEVLCAPLNCVLSPLRQIESMVIDSASFSKIHGNVYRLNFMVKNTAAMALALPAIELTLTNSSDQAVVRRVFLPAELGGRMETMAPGIEWSASAVAALKLAGSADQVAGYRVVAFYP